MKPFSFLTTKELKPILALLKEQWGYEEKLEYAFVLTDKERIYIVNRSIDALDLTKLRINSVGLYFAEFRNNELRLSIEGSQIIGPKATKNVVELDNAELKQWLRGEDLEKQNGAQGFVIIKHGNDYLGCGKCKEGKILNFVPKARRLMNIVGDEE